MNVRLWRKKKLGLSRPHATVLTAQLLPLFGLEPCEWRLCIDYSQVAALQENKDGLHARIREDFKAGVIDLYTAQVERGLNLSRLGKGRERGKRLETFALIPSFSIKMDIQLMPDFTPLNPA